MKRRRVCGGSGHPECKEAGLGVCVAVTNKKLRKTIAESVRVR